MGRGTTETGLWASLHPVAHGAQSLPPFKFQHSTLLSPRIFWIFVPFSAALGLCWSRDEQSPARSLCPCIDIPPAPWHGQSPSSSHCGQGRNVPSSHLVPMLMVLRASSCLAPSAKHTPCLVFLRWQINVLVSCGLAHSFSRSAVLGDKGRGPLPGHPMARAQKVPGWGDGGVASRWPGRDAAGSLCPWSLAGN